MGIDTEILSMARSFFKADTGIFLKRLPELTEPCAYLEDSLTRVLFNPGDSQDWTYTGEQFFAMWMDPFVKHMRTHADFLVSSFDDPKNVPREKAATQLARVISAKKNQKEDLSGMYKASMQFEAGGIYDPSESSRDAQGQIQRHVAPFNLKAVQAGPRELRNKLWNYLFQRLKTFIFSPSCSMYLEIDSQSAWKICGQQGIERDLESAHNHGESDPSMGFWLTKGCLQTDQPRIGIVRSKDGDLVPILLHFIERADKMLPAGAPPGKPIYWKQSSDSFIEMRTYLRLVKRQHKMNASQYMIFCILCGTDFVDKKTLCHGFGASKILEAMQGVRAAFDCWDTVREPTDEADIENEKDALWMFVRQLYYTKLSGLAPGMHGVAMNKNNTHLHGKAALLPSVEVLTRAFAEKGKVIQVPTQDSFDKAYKKIAFNYRYWRDESKWPAKYQQPAQPERAPKRRKVEVEVEEEPAAAASAEAPAEKPYTIEDAQFAQERLMKDLMDDLDKKAAAAIDATVQTALKDIEDLTQDDHKVIKRVHVKAGTSRSGKKRKSTDLANTQVKAHA